MPKDMLRPIMTNSEQIAGREFGANAYAKPAAALSVLRETIMGPELFDYAFKEYSRRWAFKHPDPADFFRTMEDASAVDLDWFWRGSGLPASKQANAFRVRGCGTPRG